MNSDTPREGSASLSQSRLDRVPASAIIVVIALLSASVLVGELPGRPLILHTLQKLAHPVVFGSIAVMILTLERRRAAVHTLGCYARAFCITVLLGAATEVGQLLTHRDPSWRDVLLDARGAACTLLLAAALDRGCRLTRYARASAVLLWVLGTALAATLVAPLVWSASAYASRHARFPILFIPASRLDILLVSLTDSSPELTLVPTPFSRDRGELGLRVPLTARPYAGIVLDEPSPDWRGFERLRIEVSNPARAELDLHIRVQDRGHDGMAWDRYEGHAVLAAGQRRWIEIPVSEIESGPRGRHLDLGHIAALTLYRTGADGPRELWLHRIELR